jgi:diacylglycerol kinase family enzyme
MNGQFIDRFDVTPRAHPNDGRVDVLTVAETMTLRDRWRARGRLPSGTHVPHPAITVRQVSSIELSFDAPMRIVVDGVPAGESRTLRLEVEPDALTVCV